MENPAQRRARRRLERRMRALDRLDARYGLGAMPARLPRSLRTPRAPRAPRRRPGQLRQVLVVSGVSALSVSLIGALLAVSPGRPGSLFRSLTGINRAERPLPVVRADTTGSFSFLRTSPGGAPITYDPCRSLHFVVNPVDGPANFLDFVLPAFRQIQDASGLEFLYVGTTTDPWRSRQEGPSERPILVTFNDPADVAGLRGRTVGLGGSLAVTLDGRSPRLVAGSIALDAPWFRDASSHGRTAQQQAIVMHELGHVVGLDHVDDPGEIMTAENTGQLRLGPGDLAGLARLGAGTCD